MYACLIVLYCFTSIKLLTLFGMMDYFTELLRVV